MLNTMRTRNWLLAGLLCLLHASTGRDSRHRQCQAPPIKLTQEEVGVKDLSGQVHHPSRRATGIAD